MNRGQAPFTGCCYREREPVPRCSLDFNKPRRDSRIDYFRKGVDDEPLIQEWIINYNPPKENPTQSENQVGSGEG